jgi:hypothetical protein
MSGVFTGVGPEAETIVEPGGGKQSKPLARLDLIPMTALVHVGKILDQGAAKYGENNWRKIPWRSHVNKALIHLAALLAGDAQDDHIGHACCRMQMALEAYLTSGPETPAAPPG